MIGSLIIDCCDEIRATRTKGTAKLRTLLLLILILTLLFGWQRLVWTVTPASGSFPLAEARFAKGVAGAFPGLACYCASSGMPPKLLSDLQFVQEALPDLQY